MQKLKDKVNAGKSYNQVAKECEITVPRPAPGNTVAWSLFLEVNDSRHMVSGMSICSIGPRWEEIYFLAEKVYGVEIDFETHQKLKSCFNRLAIIEQCHRDARGK